LKKREARAILNQNCSERMKKVNVLEEDEKGIVPAPAESEEQFAKRVKECLSLRSFIQKKLQIFDNKDLASPPCTEKAYEKARTFFHICPKWSPLFFSNKRLLPWHGACTWIIQLTQDGPWTGFIQLRKGLAKGSILLGLYKTEDVLAHEFAHLGRLEFKEPRFEEALACRVFPSSLRRILSTLFKRRTESFLFAAVVIALLLLDLLFLLLNSPSSYMAFFPLKLIPIGILFLLAIRSFWDEKILQKAEKQVAKWKIDPLPFLYRLTDKEIAYLGKRQEVSPEQFCQMFEEHTPRWKVLKQRYLHKSPT
jgi:hypothetical protein